MGWGFLVVSLHWSWNLIRFEGTVLSAKDCIWKCVIRIQERSCWVHWGLSGLGFFALYLDIDILLCDRALQQYLMCSFFFLGSVSHTQAPTSTIVTMTMPSHSSHATAVTTSNIPVGEWFQFQGKCILGTLVILFMPAMFVHWHIKEGKQINSSWEKSTRRSAVAQLISVPERNRCSRRNK